MGIIKNLFSKGECPELRNLIERSGNHLATLTEGHQAGWGFGEEEYWDLDQDEGYLHFTFDETMVASCPAQIIGTYNSDEKTWMWAWANTSIAAELTRDAEEVKSYGLKYGISKLTKPKWKGEEEDAWNMAAIACYLCDAQGAYRGPSDPIFVFMTFGEVKISKDILK
jgi:hypothetical protein